MNILLLGSGGREHALARALTADPVTTNLYAAPGNPGIAEIATTLNLDPTDGPAVAAAAKTHEIDLVVVGPEAPLVAGVADAVRAAGIPCFGPSAAAAQLEGSKAFAKEIMAAAGVPTGDSRTCRTMADVDAALAHFGAPYVVKDDGLAAGKGVVVTEDSGEARAHAAACLGAAPETASGHAAGPAAAPSDETARRQVVIEEFLDGPEVSLFCICDGATVVPLAPAQDFKRVFDGQQGPNTGGMGAYSPLPWAPDGLVEEVVRTVAQPVVDEMARRGIPFTGVLYCGLALTRRGVRVIEFNVRFGDPETQAVLARLATPLATLLSAAANGELAAAEQPEWGAGAAVTVVIAAENYPGTPRTGDPIRGVDEANALSDVHVIHAGTRLSDGELLSSGGRVLCVVGEGEDIEAARERAYAGVALIDLPGAHHRTDIAANTARITVD